MQTLVFNTTDRTVKLYRDLHISDVESSQILYDFYNIPTVKIRDGFYEVMQEEKTLLTTHPILRVPIANTNMVIVK